MRRTLLLNTDYRPIAAVSGHKAITLVLVGKAEVIEEYSEVCHSQHFDMPVPSIIRLRYHVKVPYRTVIRLTKKGLLARDKGRCAYCSNKATTIDHIRPRSRGGKHTWQNVVACCKACNQTKGNRQLSELNWQLRIKPFAPTGIRAVAGLLNPEQAWLPYIQSIEEALAS